MREQTNLLSIIVKGENGSCWWETERNRVASSHVSVAMESLYYVLRLSINNKTLENE